MIAEEREALSADFVTHILREVAVATAAASISSVGFIVKAKRP